jgi:hypothetical protein
MINVVLTFLVESLQGTAWQVPLWMSQYSWV